MPTPIQPIIPNSLLIAAISSLWLSLIAMALYIKSLHKSGSKREAERNGRMELISINIL